VLPVIIIIVAFLFPVKKRRQPANKKRWSDEESEAVRKSFAKYFIIGQLPGKLEIEELIRHNPCLSSRTWRNVKDFVRNHQK